jgi:ubiquinone/menaquinone biosynthesis C-methylase UbiE
MVSIAELQTTRDFWDSNPCGARGSFEAQRVQRYAMEPWLPAQLRRMAGEHRSILEIGCGQGVDSIELCARMRGDGVYIGIDYSRASLSAATANAASQRHHLAVQPSYLPGNAESLQFADASFEAVYSMGVLHHTADPPTGISEAWRVLRGGGRAYIALYRRPSLKVGVAKMLRGAQSCLDAVVGTERCVYKALRYRGSGSARFGTMFLECFGVPFMYWYHRNDIEQLFKAFHHVQIAAYGNNLGMLSRKQSPNNAGYLWFVEATK